MAARLNVTGFSKTTFKLARNSIALRETAVVAYRGFDAIQNKALASQCPTTLYANAENGHIAKSC
jgi:hypothetical protein